MEQFFKPPQTLSRLREGPLGPSLDACTQQVCEQGYARSSARLQRRLVADFRRWLTPQGLPVHALIPEHPTSYLRYRAQPQRPRSGEAAALERLLDLLRRAGAIAEPPVPLAKPPAQQDTDAFGLYLRQERALASTTVPYYLAFVRRFLRDRCADGPVALAALGAADVLGFVPRQAAGLPPKRAKLMTTARRSFLHYAHYRGAVLLDLTAAVPTVAPWSMASRPRALPPDHGARVFAQGNRQTAIGRRDYALLLLLARLGLRAGEGVSLQLEDIAWDAGCVPVRGNGGHWSQRPLPIEVGEAIAPSVPQGRPAGASRRGFMRQKAPRIGLANALAMCTLVARALVRAGVEAPEKGAPLFRHPLAPTMLRQGASWAEIGELLCHQSLQTTTIYAKVALAALRTLAAPWPGGVPCTPYEKRSQGIWRFGVVWNARGATLASDSGTASRSWSSRALPSSRRPWRWRGHSHPRQLGRRSGRGA
jgi:integrase/recombinase XerD